MKGIAANFVMTKEELQPMYLNQRQILTDLVDLLSDNEDKYLEPIFAADYKDAANEQGRLRVVIDQVASLTDASALEWHASLVKGESYEPKLF